MYCELWPKLTGLLLATLRYSTLFCELYVQPSRDYSSFTYQPSDLLTYILFCHSIKSVQKTYHINWAWNINRFIYRSAIKTKELKAIFDNILIFLSDVRKVLLVCPT